MDKRKISQNQKNASKYNWDKMPGVTRWDPLKELLDEKRMGESIVECLKNNDPEGVMEMIQIYVDALATQKKRLREKNNMPKSTMYHSLRNKNPTIKTLAKWVYGCVHQ